MEESQQKRVGILERKTVLYALAITQSIVWGFSFIGTKAALVRLTPLEVIAVRWTLAAVLLVVLAFLGIIKVNFKGKNLKLVLAAAFVQPCIYSACEAYGVSLTTTSESSILIAMGPVVVMLISVLFLKVKVDRISIGAVFMAFLGVLFAIATNDDFSLGGKYLGYMILTVGVICNAVFTIASNRISDRFSPMEITLAMAVQGSIFFNTVSLACGRGFAMYQICFTDVRTGLAVAFLGLGCTCFCYMIFNIVVSRLPAHVAAALQTNLVTLTGVISGIMIKGDSWNLYTVIGLAVMLAGIVIVNRPTSRSKEKKMEMFASETDFLTKKEENAGFSKEGAEPAVAKG